MLSHLRKWYIVHTTRGALTKGLRASQNNGTTVGFKSANLPKPSPVAQWKTHGKRFLRGLIPFVGGRTETTELRLLSHYPFMNIGTTTMWYTYQTQFWGAYPTILDLAVFCCAFTRTLEGRHQRQLQENNCTPTVQASGSLKGHKFCWRAHKMSFPFLCGATSMLWDESLNGFRVPWGTDNHGTSAATRATLTT